MVDHKLMMDVELAVTGASLHAVRQVVSVYCGRAGLAEVRRRRGTPDVGLEHAVDARERALRGFLSHRSLARLRDEAVAAAALDDGT